VIPFGRVVWPIWADHAVPRGYLVPQQSSWRAWRSDPRHIDGEPVGMERVKLVDKAADPECGRPVGRENSRERQPGLTRLSNGGGQPVTNAGCSRAIARSGRCRIIVYPGVAVAIRYARDCAVSAASFSVWEHELAIANEGSDM
jgi:hypothetical protein